MNIGEFLQANTNCIFCNKKYEIFIGSSPSSKKRPSFLNNEFFVMEIWPNFSYNPIKSKKYYFNVKLQLNAHQISIELYQEETEEEPGKKLDFFSLDKIEFLKRKLQLKNLIIFLNCKKCNYTHESNAFSFDFKNATYGNLQSESNTFIVCHDNTEYTIEQVISRNQTFITMEEDYNTKLLALVPYFKVNNKNELLNKMKTILLFS